MPIQKGPGHGENSEPLNFGIEKKGEFPGDCEPSHKLQPEARLMPSPGDNLHELSRSE